MAMAIGREHDLGIANDRFSKLAVPGEGPLPIFISGRYGHAAELGPLKFDAGKEPFKF